MNSFNHYAYGAIGDWMYRVVAGLDTDPDGPGYKKIRIQPYPGKELTRASASLETYYGKAFSGWSTEGNNFTMDVEIPANTTATVYIPATPNSSITENGNPLQESKDLKVIGRGTSYTVVQLGSGTYHFVSNFQTNN